MQATEFETVKSEFEKADTDKKIMMYVEAQGLTTQQYKELLRLFPLNELKRLEAALS